MAASESCRFVILAGGLALPIEPMMLALELEERGFTLTRESDDVLNVQPYQRLTSEDCDRIRRWKRHLLAIAEYEAREVA